MLKLCIKFYYENFGSGKHFFGITEVLNKVNYSTISKLFDKFLRIVCPNGIKHGYVLLLLNDFTL